MDKLDDLPPGVTAKRLARLSGIWIAVVARRSSSDIFNDPLSDPITVGLDRFTAPKRAFEKLETACGWVRVKTLGLAYIMVVGSTSIRVRHEGAALSRAAEQLELDGTTMWMDTDPTRYLELSIQQVGEEWTARLKEIADDGSLSREWEIEPEQITYEAACAPLLLAPLVEPKVVHEPSLADSPSEGDEIAAAEFSFKDGLSPRRTSEEEPAEEAEADLKVTEDESASDDD